MKAALLLAVLALPGWAQTGRFDRTNSRTPQGRSTRGLLGNSAPFSEFAPPSGEGMGTACACAAVTGTRGEPLTFTRAGVAWCTKNDYSLAECAANQPRIMSGTGGTSPLGILMEEAVLNNVTQNRDLSQAVWTKTSMTCTKTATGPDAVTNSASICTASAANGTALQATVIAAATRNTSMYIRRRTGTGAVQVTRDNGTTWTAITSGLTSTWKRVVSTEAVGCAYGNCIITPAMTSGIANPTVGIRVVTSGDAVDVDLAQDEPADWPTSPVTTGAATASRAVEAASFSTAGAQILSMAYSIVATGFTGAFKTGVDTRISGTQFFASYLQSFPIGGAAYCYAYTGAGSAASSVMYVPPLGPTPVRCSLNPGVSTTVNVLGSTTTTATVGGTFTSSVFTVGSGTGVPNAVITGVCADTSPNACAPRQTHPTAIAWIGDSITLGDAAAPSRPPVVLRGLRPGRTIYNFGVNGTPVSQCRSVAAGAIESGVSTLVLLCGVNSINLGAAAVWADLEAALDNARLAGRKVVPVKLTPWASAATWFPAYQTSQDSINASMQAWCDTNGVTCVDTSSLGTGSPATLLPAYDSGDGLHLNAAGATALAALVDAANP